MVALKVADSMIVKRLFGYLHQPELSLVIDMNTLIADHG